MIFRYCLLSAVFFLLFNFDQICCEDPGHFFLKATKSVPRIGRSNKSNEEFEKFFLKASKSVPRIGRRGSELNANYEKEIKGLPYPYQFNRQEEVQQKKFRYPTWSELADTFEYNPDLLSDPQLLSELESKMADDPSVYEWNKIRIKRTTVSPDISENFEEMK